MTARPAVILIAALLLALPAHAGAATTIGSDLGASGDAVQCGSDCTLSNESIPGRTVRVPSDGVIVRWRVRDGFGPRALKVVRQPGADDDVATGAGTSATETVTATGISTFETRLPVLAGDRIGMDLPAGGGTLYGRRVSTGAVVDDWRPPLSDGEASRTATFPDGGSELLLNADIEPDADRDGFGDESQDACPSDASTQGACPITTSGPITTASPLPGNCANARGGTAGNDNLNGTTAGDRLLGLGGNDILNGLAGNDCLEGGSGRDRLSGASGNDRLAGGTASDKLSGGTGKDRLAGGTGHDGLNAGTGNDTLDGSSGNDVLDGGSGDDLLKGGSGADRINGGTGRNRVLAGSGNDSIAAANGRRERISCGAGRDRVTADRGDRLSGCERVSRAP